MEQRKEGAGEAKERDSHAWQNQYIHDNTRESVTFVVKIISQQEMFSEGMWPASQEQSRTVKDPGPSSAVKDNAEQQV